MEPKTKLEVSKAEAERIRERVRAVRTLESAGGSSRLATIADAPSILKLLSDERVSGDVYTLPRPFSLASITAWIKDHQSQAKDGVGLLMVAEDEAGGIITITDFQFWPNYAACEFGGVIAAHLQSKSIGTKGMAHLCDWVFKELGIRLLVMTASLDNIRSHKLLRGLNFTQMGEMDSVRPDGSVRKSLYWELVGGGKRLEQALKTKNTKYMKTPPFSGDDAKRKCLEMIAKGASLEDILEFLKKAEFSQGISTFVISKVYGIEHEEAKYKIIHSSAWSENYEANIEIQKHLDVIFSNDCDPD